MKRKLISCFLCITGGMICSAAYGERIIKRYSETTEKIQLYFSLLNQWLALKNDDMSIEKYFIENDIKTIAIYGFGEIGKLLYKEIKSNNIDVKYVVDKNADTIKAEIPVLKKTDVLEKVDALVVTAAYYFDEIEREMSQKVDFPIISLEEIIYGV